MSDAKAVFFGELLMRLGTKRHERFVQAQEFAVAYTGAEANAAVTLAHFGLETFVVAVVPENEIGQACINYLRQFGLHTGHIKRGGQRLGTLYLETGASQRASKVIYDRAGSAFTELEPGEIAWDEIFAGKDWFHFCGTAPALADNVAKVVEEACRSAREHGLTVSCDLNYRSKLWTPDEAKAVMVGLMEYVDVLIGNEEHADIMLGISAGSSGTADEARCVDVARRLHEAFGFKYVALGLREGLSASDTRWSGLLHDGRAPYFSAEYAIRVVDRVGGGDAFSGGLIYGLLTGMAPRAAVEFAAAASCLKHSIHGDFNLVSVDEVMALVGGESSGRVQR